MSCGAYSKRFQRNIRITRHAIKRIAERSLSDCLLLDLIETGTLKLKDQEHGWMFKHYPDRDDNLICAALLLGEAVIVKTVMHHFEEI